MRKACIWNSLIQFKSPGINSISIERNAHTTQIDARTHATTTTTPNMCACMCEMACALCVSLELHSN